ncbi:MAG TPA: cob(I)yrinic acid a,c-diamide adenosyltransferase [Deltaproteobacteria bacterium]|nr:cob(I)yrinic acid a,c-diamide adenosyltransferase [Deltaproteobacteria bacterium]
MNEIGAGYIHIYTGDGKGKTTAALGLALRAAGHGMKTCVVQFMKGQHYGELDAVKHLSAFLNIEQFGSPFFCSFTDPPDEADVRRARAGLGRVRELMEAGSCDVLVADEIITASLFKLISETEVLEIMAAKPGGLELILTGRGATEAMIEAADLVTEMREIKHYYTKGVQARPGIES